MSHVGDIEDHLQLVLDLLDIAHVLFPLLGRLTLLE